MEKKYWLFHSNPKVWDSYGELSEYSEGSWSLNKKDIKSIKAGDQFMLWVSGKENFGPGIYAIGEVLSEPVLRFDDFKRNKFRKSTTKKVKKSLQVNLHYSIKIQNNPLKRSEILAYDFIKNDSNWHNVKQLRLEEAC